MVKTMYGIWMSLALVISNGLFAAQAPTFTLSLEDVDEYKDPGTKKTLPTVFEGQSFTLKVELVNAQENDGLDHVIIKGVDDFECCGKSSHRSYVSHNGVMQTTHSKLLTYQPKHGGVFTIGPAQVTMSGKQFASNSLEMCVRKEESDDKNNRQKRRRHAGSQLVADIDDVQASLKLEEQKIYVGQPFMIVLRFVPPVQLLDLKSIDHSSLDDFYVKAAQHPVRKFETIGGKEREVYEQSILLIPKTHGRKTIEPFSINYLPADHSSQSIQAMFFGGFGQYRRIKTNPLTFDVKPLPQHGGNVDTVGRIDRCTLTVGKNQVTLNEPFKCVLEIEGLCDLERLDVPALTLPPHFRAYESTAQIYDDRRNLLNGGVKEFEYVLQAGRVGEWKIDPQVISYFDTTTGQYRKYQTEPITIMVLPAATDAPDHEQHGLAPAPVSQSEQGLEIKEKLLQELPVKTEKPMPQGWARKGLPWAIFLLSVTIPLLFFYFIPTIKALRRRYRDRKYQKWTIKERILYDLNQADLERNDVALYQVFMKYFALRYDVSLPLISEEWIERRLLDEGMAPGKVAQLLDYLHACASLAFTGYMHDQQRIQQLKEKGIFWIDELEQCYEQVITKGME